MSEEQTSIREQPRGKLVIRRRSGQTLVIPELGITITFTIEGKQVKLVVDAPKSIAVKRGELLQESANPL